MAIGPDGTSTPGTQDPKSGLHVLVIEDAPAIGLQLERGLIRAGYRVSRAADGAQALLAGPADVILLDLGLPDMDGLELCARLRARSTAAIIAVTARSEEATSLSGSSSCSPGSVPCCAASTLPRQGCCVTAPSPSTQGRAGCRWRTARLP